MTTRPILLLKTGDAVEEVRVGRGDFDAWFERLLGRAPGDYRVVQVHRDELLPPGRGLGGVLITGSPSSLTEDQPWMGEAAGWVRATAEEGVPVLGICFGHQLVADAFGGTVARNPRGREFGTVEVSLTPAGIDDPLFEGLPPRLVVQQSHSDAVLGMPDGAEILAENDRTPCQAMRIDDHVRTVQFHPEFDSAIVQGFIDARRHLIAEEADALGVDAESHLASIRAGVRDSEDGTRVLQNWLRHFVDRA